MSRSIEPPSTPARIDRLWQYLEADPGNTTLLRDIAREGLSSGAYEHTLRALDRLQELQASEPGDEAAAIHALLKLGRIAEACERGHRAHAQWPQDEAVRVETARALLNARRFDETLACCEGDFAEPTLQQMAGEFELQALWHQGELERALERAAQLVKQFPGNPRLLAQYSALLYDEERVAEAFQAAHQAYALSPQHAYAALHVLASERLMHRDADGALKLVEEAQRQRSDDGRVWLLKGSALLMAGKVEEAIGDLKRALAIYPDHPGTHLTLAWACISLGRLDEAEAALHDAIEASPAFAESHGTLAVVQALKGQTEEAEQSIRRASLLDKDSFAARYARSLLDGHPPGSVEAIYGDLAQRVKI